MDAILCDLRMPEMDGPGFYHELKSRNRKLSQRVIFVSGDALSLSPEQRQALDGRPVLEKPFSLAELSAALAKIVPVERLDANVQNTS
jgi:CheY-like chemotaxis protein